MSEPKFTPGPLTVGPEDDCFAVRDEWGNVTAFPNPGHFSKETQQANMMLYAAAPEMYERLQEAVIEFCHNCPHRSGDAECKEMNDVCFIQSWVKTLKKARGEA